MPAAPPVFSDIAKCTNDLIGKDFPTGVVKFEANTTTDNGVKFTVLANKDAKSGAIASELKAKYTHKPSGTTITKTFNSAALGTMQVELVDKLAKGVKVELNTSLTTPVKGAAFTKLGVEYKRAGPHVALTSRASVDLYKGPFLLVDTVLMAQHGMLAGAEFGYDVASGKVSKINYATGFVAKDFTVALLAHQHCTTFNLAYYHRVSDALEAGAKATWSRVDSPSVVGVEFATKYVLDRDAFIKTKIDSTGKVGLGYSQVLRPGIKLAFGALVDTGKLDEGSHKLGLSFTFEA